MAIFDVTKPATSTRFNSQQLRDNFTALGRANDLRCRASNPPDLNVNVEAGIFSVNSTSATQFDGGFVTIDTITGGAIGQERVFVIEISQVIDGYGDITGELVVNTSGLWAPAGTATAPTFTSGNIGLCTVTVAFQDTEIADDQIIDIRPLVNLGSSAIPPTGLALADLSDVDGNQSAAFAAADSPTALNPFLTPTTEPIPTIESDISTLQTDTSDHFAGTGNRHTAADLDVVDNFTFSNAVELQTFADDVETNIFLRVSPEHKSDGTHGPRVTIDQTGSNNALTVLKSDTSSVDAITFGNLGTGKTVEITHNSTDSSNEPVVDVSRTGISGSSIPVVNIAIDSTFGEVLHVQTTDENHTTSQRVARITQAGRGGALIVTRNNTTSSTNPAATLQVVDTLDMSGATIGGTRGLSVSVTGTGGLFPAMRVVNQGGGPSIEIDSGTAAGAGIRIDQTGPADGLVVNKTNTAGGDAIDITNSGTGTDIRGNLARWSVTSSGDSRFGNVRAGGGSGISQGFLVLTEGATLIATVAGLITPTHSSHEVQSNSGTSDDIDNIETSGVPDGTIVVLSPVSGHTITFRDSQGGPGELRTPGGSNDTLNTIYDNITFRLKGSVWYTIAREENIS